ncbi:MAG: hypothetical protein M3X11_23695 [Acidobacteriota bacterium]|nr:hypothetical protein [Acidobacteriota bacterium]
MTELLEKAFSQASRLPLEQQNAVATLLLKEMESEQKWAESFARSQDMLSRMADEALMEFSC